AQRGECPCGCAPTCSRASPLWRRTPRSARHPRLHAPRPQRPLRRRLRGTSTATGMPSATRSTTTDTDTEMGSVTETRTKATRYELERELGRGGIAIVYAALDTEMGPPVALKRLAAQLAGDPDFRRRFLPAARIPGPLSPPTPLPG